MEPNAKYAFVGTTIIVCCGLILFAVLWISNVGVNTKRQYYLIYFVDHTLDGLQKDADVTMQGIKVGSVGSLEIDSKRFDRVKVIVRVAEGTPITTDAYATIKRNLLTGIAWIELNPGMPGKPALTSLSNKDELAVIPEGRTELDKIADSVPALVDKVGRIVERIEDILSVENAQSVRNILTNVEDVSAVIASKGSDIASAIESIDKTSKRLASLTDSLAAIADKGESQFDDISSAIQNAALQIETTTKELESRFEKAAESLSGSSQIIAQQILILTQNMSQAAARLAVTAERFENPRSIITGPSKSELGPGER